MDRYELIQDRFFMAQLLLDELERLADQLDPSKGDLPYILERAYNTQSKMKAFYEKWDEPPVMLEQINQINAVIKRLELLHTNYVNSL